MSEEGQEEEEDEARISSGAAPMCNGARRVAGNECQSGRNSKHRTQDEEEEKWRGISGVLPDEVRQAG